MRADVADLVSPDPGSGTDVTTVCSTNCLTATDHYGSVLRTPGDETGTTARLLDGPVASHGRARDRSCSARSVQLACTYRRSTRSAAGVCGPLFLLVDDGERQSYEAFQTGYGCPSDGRGPALS